MKFEEEFDYGKSVNAWLGDGCLMPGGKLTPELYYRAIEEKAAEMAGDEILCSQLGVRQKRKPASQVFEYILELLPPDDFMCFLYHEPTAPFSVLLQAAYIYDKECMEKALHALKQESVPEIGHDVYAAAAASF